MATKTTLIIGSEGQVGSELLDQLRSIYNPQTIIASDIHPESKKSNHTGPYEQLDIQDYERLASLVTKYQVTEIYNLAAILSASAEKQPNLAWEINMNGLLNTLWLAKETGIKKIYWPSSIAVFGPTTPKSNTPQDTIMDPNTVYGISKLAGERWCQYFFDNYGIETRSIRYPGLISYSTPPGGGTTDYAVDIFHQALETGTYTSFLKPDTSLPMLYMPDAIRGTIELMHADKNKISIHSSYNLGGFSLSPNILSEAIKQEIPRFEIYYNPDFRQDIADTWPDSIDDSKAQIDWGWTPHYSIHGMVMDMLKNLNTLKNNYQA